MQMKSDAQQATLHDAISRMYDASPAKLSLLGRPCNSGSDWSSAEEKLTRRDEVVGKMTHESQKRWASGSLHTVPPEKPTGCGWGGLAVRFGALM